MKSELITKLNTEISVIDPVAIRQHLEYGDLDEWIYDWREEIASTSFALFFLLSDMAKMLGIEVKK